MLKAEGELRRLYAEVTESMLKAERLEGGEAQEEFVRVSMLEEQIADLLEVDDVEGEISRQGAVSASLRAGMAWRAHDLAERYLREGGAEDHLEVLRELRSAAQVLLEENADEWELKRGAGPSGGKC